MLLYIYQCPSHGVLQPTQRSLCQIHEAAVASSKLPACCSRNANLPELLYIDCGGRLDKVAEYTLWLYRPRVKTDIAINAVMLFSTGENPPKSI